MRVTVIAVDEDGQELRREVAEAPEVHMAANGWAVITDQSVRDATHLVAGVVVSDHEAAERPAVVTDDAGTRYELLVRSEFKSEDQSSTDESIGGPRAIVTLRRLPQPDPIVVPVASPGPGNPTALGRNVAEDSEEEEEEEEEEEVRQPEPGPGPGPNDDPYQVGDSDSGDYYELEDVVVAPVPNAAPIVQPSSVDASQLYQQVSDQVVLVASGARTAEAAWDDLLTGDKCSICLTDVMAGVLGGKRVVQFPCGHLMDLQCAQEAVIWGTPLCPVCRGPLAADENGQVTLSEVTSALGDALGNAWTAFASATMGAQVVTDQDSLLAALDNDQLTEIVIVDGDLDLVGPVTKRIRVEDGTVRMTNVVGVEIHGGICVVDGGTLTVTGGSVHTYGHTEVQISGGELGAHGTSVVTASGTAQVGAHDQSVVLVTSEGAGVHVYAIDQSTVTCYAGTVQVHGSEVNLIADGATIIPDD